MKSTHLVNIALALVLLFLVWINSFKRDFSQPNLDLLPDMAYSPAYAAFSVNPNFADGKTLQQPVANSIRRGSLPLHFEAGEDEAIRAGVELANPFTAEDPAALTRGEFIFTTFCIPCHGAGGNGDGLVAMRGFPPPPSFLTGDTTQWPDGRLFHIITFGGTNMSSYAYQVTPDDRWKVILYIRSIQEEARLAAEQAALAAAQLAELSEKPNQGLMAEDSLLGEGAEGTQVYATDADGFLVDFEGKFLLDEDGNPVRVPDGFQISFEIPKGAHIQTPQLETDAENQPDETVETPPEEVPTDTTPGDQPEDEDKPQ